MIQTLSAWKKGAFCLIAAAALAAALITSTAVFATPAAGVYVDDMGAWFDSTNPYLCGGAASPAGPLDGAACTAEFDTVTGTLTLWNYNGGAIYVPASGDLAINLVGVNSIFTTTGTIGINANSSGSVVVTSTSEGSLAIDVEQGGGAIICGIYSSGDTTISGSANVSIDVLDTGGVSANGIYASGSINILDSASLNVIAESTSAAPNAAFALNSFTGGININTTGDVTLDSSRQTSDSAVIYVFTGDVNLVRANILTLLYSGVGCTGYGCAGTTSILYGGVFNYDPSLFDFDSGEGFEIYTWITSDGDGDGDDEEEPGMPSTGFFAKPSQTDAVIATMVPVVSLVLLAGGVFAAAKKFTKK